MKKGTLTLLFCMMMCLAFGQKHRPLPRPFMANYDKLAEKYYQCLHRNKYTAVQRRHFYPFNKAVSVKLVSFENYIYPPDAKIHIDGDTSKQVNSDSIYESKIPFRKGFVNYAVFKEIKTLNKAQVNKLTDILYNTGYAGPQLIADPGASCFNPRNAILFIDAKGKTFAYIDICFECQRYNASSEKIKMGEFCEQKYDLIKNFFGSTGLEFGIIRGEHGKV